MKKGQEIDLSKGFLPDPEQKTVVEAGADEWLLVIAGPGTGKTQVAAMRLVHLLESGLHPAQILVLSFSRSAVATLTKRIASLQLENPAILEDLRHLAIRTFDSWSFRMLRQCGGAVPELLSRSHDDNIVAVTEAISDHANDAVTARLNGIRHVIVDEFQDLPGVRAKMVVELLSRLTESENSNVGFTVLGDPAQAIYSFAARLSGHDNLVDPWQDLRTRMGKKLREIVLAKNHRSTDKLAAMADSLRKILQNRNHDPKRKLKAIQLFLSRLPASSSDEKLGPQWLGQLPQGSVAILARTNGEALQVAKMLYGSSNEGPNVPLRLRLAGSSPTVPAWISVLFSRFKPQTISRSTFDTVYDKTAGQAVIAMHEALSIPKKDIAWRRLARASGASDTATSIDLAALRERLDWTDSFPDDQLEEDGGVYITTIHQAKGMEFDNVALLEHKPRDEAGTDENPLEEANVGFVAVTRAGKELGRIPSGCIYRAPYEWHSPSGRNRQVSWGGMVNVVLGLPGDIDPTSFVDMGLHGSEDKIATLQNQLMNRAADFCGHKIVLVNSNSVRARDVTYDIFLQEDNQDGLLIGRTTKLMTRDLLGLLWDKGYGLPYRIFNLRISDIVTMTATGDTSESIPDPWRTSRLWFGISLIGTGDFKARKRHG